MADLKSASKRIILRDLLVEGFDLIDQGIKGLICKRVLISREPFRIKSRFHLKEAESPPQRIIDHGKAPVSGIHHTNDIQIWRYRERHPAVGKRCACPPVVFFNQHQELAEYLTHVSTVDLVYNEEIVFLRMVCRFLAETIKDPFCQLELCAIRMIPHNKVFIGIILMELYQFDPVIIYNTHDGVSQFTGCKCLSYAWCSLQNNIFLRFHESRKNIKALSGHEDLAQKIIPGIILHYGRSLPQGIFITDEIHDEVEFPLGQLKEAPVRIFKELHHLKFRTLMEYSIVNRRLQAFCFLKTDRLSIVLLCYFP